jgi:peptide/nickel transport system permease protein
MTLDPHSAESASSEPAEPGGVGPVTGEVPAGVVGTPKGEVWKRYRRNRLAMVGLGLIALLVLAAVFAPLITFYSPTAINTDIGRQPPSRSHWFGTDLTGRDIYTRIVYGARTSLRVGILSATLATTIGMVAGALAGYYGRFIDTLLMRLTDIFLAFPYILAAIAIIVVVGRGENTVILVLGLLGWMPIARIFRSSIMQVKNVEFVEAARAVGCSDFRIITRHLMPNAVQPVIVYATLFVGTAVLSEAALSFLAIGITEPTPSWGLMIAQGRSYLATSPHMLFFPGAAIFVTVVAFVFAGDGLRDALDPKLR